MTRLSKLILKQGKLLLENKRYATFSAVLLAIGPHTAWLSLVVIALVTLRKGWRAGSFLLMPVLTVHLAISYASFTYSVNDAIANSLLTFLPCYLAACTLRFTTSWRMVSGVFFLQALLIVLLLQIFMPEFIMAQYMYLQAMIRETQPNSVLLSFLSDTNPVMQATLANSLLGIQIVLVVLLAATSLMLARLLQSQLFYPGGFKQELIMFRGNRIGSLMLVCIFVAAMQHNVVAINILPLLMLYFVLAGLSLCVHALEKKKSWMIVLMLITPVVLVPFVFIPVYIILGSLDTLFNFRLYLPSKAGNAT
jgi:hypothetical protein